MEVDESIEVAPSADNGNVPAESVAPITPTPNEPTETDPPAEPKEGEPTTPTEAELFELPDGRKVDAATLTREWKENFLPDYTRKSQALAKVGETINPNPLPTPPANPLADPNYVPQTYEELAAQIEARLEAKNAEKEAARVAQQQALETAVETQLSEVKAIDPKVNESALFLHATKYGFRDLRLAHQNMRDMSETIKKTQTTTAANIAKRNDPVSATPGATGAKPDPSQFATSREYLRALNGGQ